MKYGNIKIEVKSAAYIQGWDQDKYQSESRIAKRRNKKLENSACKNHPSHFEDLISLKTVTHGKQTLPLKLTATLICAWYETQKLPAVMLE